MKKGLLVLMMLTMSVLLVSCSGETGKDEKNKENVLIDTVGLKVVYKGGSNENTDKVKEGKMVFSIENKSDENIVVQQSGLRVNGKEVEEGIVSFGIDIGANKKEDNVRLLINDFDGYKFPELKGDVQMVVKVLDGDTFMDKDEIKVVFPFEQ